MNNFVYYVPTKICFGKGEISHLAEMKESGKRVLLVYGGGSIRKNGIYDEAVRVLTDAGLTVLSMGGVEPNPKVGTVRKGIEFCRQEKIDMILAVGGGSVIDCAKAIAAGTLYGGDVWELIGDASIIKAALPVYVVLTMSATGSEMNKNAVISNPETNEKLAMYSDLLKPRLSVCDPTYTFSVPARQTAAGTADMIRHTFENYFSMIRDSALSARFGEAVLKVCFHYGPIALREPENYEARANLMWASTNAINGIAKSGMEVGWTCHPIEHELSAWYDLTHGVGLAIITPRWMRYILNKDTAWKFAEYGRNVWGLSGDDDLAVGAAAIEKTAEFFYDVMELPKTLTEVGITGEHFKEMAAHSAPALKNAFVPLTADDVEKILTACL